MFSFIYGSWAGLGGEIPRPSVRRGRKFRQIQLPPIESAKLHRYRAFQRSGLRKAELARRMGIRKTNIDRLFDLEHPSRFQRIEAAFRALGKRIVISGEEAA